MSRHHHARSPCKQKRMQKRDGISNQGQEVNAGTFWPFQWQQPMVKQLWLDGHPFPAAASNCSSRPMRPQQTAAGYCDCGGPTHLERIWLLNTPLTACTVKAAAVTPRPAVRTANGIATVEVPIPALIKLLSTLPA